MIYVLAGELSDADESAARAFLSVACEELEVAPLSQLRTLESVEAADFGPADAVVFVNPPRDEARAAVEHMLRRAADAGAVVLPVALDESARRPPEAVGDRQSFDVLDHRRRRGLTADAHGVIAKAFAREALSKILPTYMKDRVRVFLCHRRVDGEGLVARVGAQLDARHVGLVFRDLVELQAGDRAQERIDEELARADVLVFFDTPEAGDSWWIAKELAGALGRNIPIVWVRVGRDGDRVPLPVEPGAPRPHLVIEDLDPGDDLVGQLADQILEEAFELSRAHVRASHAALRALQRWARDHDAQIETLDARLMVYELTRPIAERPYPTRPAIDVIQVFARHPTEDDLDALSQYLTEQEMGPHVRNCRSFDAAVLLDPTATGHRAVGEWSVVEHPERFLASLRGEEPAKARGAPKLLLLGAFPSGDLGAVEVGAAVHTVATTWLQLGGSLVFGGHPTFTPLILEAARLVVPGYEPERVTVFQSEFYAAPAALQELAAQATVHAIPAATDRAASLAAMRIAMIRRDSADGVLALGGRTDEGGTHTPGIDEEIRLARAAGLPVHLLGATGGRAAELVERVAAEDTPFSSLRNRLSRADNERLASTDDYAGATQMIWTAVTTPGGS